MTKSLELVIAIMILFSFLFFATDIYDKPDNTIEINNKTKDLLYLKSQESTFRELITNKDIDGIYNNLYPYIDSKYTIKLCNYIDNDCIIKDDVYILDKKAIDYYFLDSNRTLSIIFWME